jgi:hypothetical protein
VFLESRTPIPPENRATSTHALSSTPHYGSSYATAQSCVARQVLLDGDAPEAAPDEEITLLRRYKHSTAVIAGWDSFWRRPQ